jgi:hypothetical protein
MSRRHEKRVKPGSRMVNVGIAPGNETRLRGYIDWYNRHPSRSRPAVTATDIVNEALDAYLSGVDPVGNGKPGV